MHRIEIANIDFQYTYGTGLLLLTTQFHIQHRLQSYFSQKVCFVGRGVPLVTMYVLLFPSHLLQCSLNL